MVKKIYLIFYDFGKQLQRDNIAAYASSIAFFFFLSLVPILLVISAAITYTPLTEENLIGLINQIIPQALDEAIVSFVDQMYMRASTILPIAIIVAIWSAGQGMRALQMGLNVAHGVYESRNYIIIRLQAAFYMLIIIFAFVVTFTASLIGKKILVIIGGFAPMLIPVYSFISKWRYLAILFLLIVIFSAIYTLVPNVKLKIKYQIPGAILAALAWVVFSWGFSIYIDNFKALSAYGSLSTIIFIMIWLYAAMYILLVGANLNKYFKPVIKVFLKTKE